ncbi:receptor-type tyrosine-protein phosphatase N2 isoform X3 [Bicyclus anynana]|uniref:Receptor-type tyrosine-protein phosphatase N2 isoform X3 n=1 Tax=Bicyclus anynana TaxID=110368 RepID=A0ABM3LEM2_BICAN|nr:receptor-type tyrosine-protein phosphatase N2 isoform X3 [Bicyclus anynana]
MGRMYAREALWALALFCTLAPSHADGNIGCLFSSSLCIEGVEWCYDDYAFGKCIPVYESDPEEGALYRYDMSSSQLQWFERELQQLATRGYRWEHAYTQCVLQSMLYALRRQLNPANVNSKLCDHFTDPKLNTAPSDDGEENIEIEPDETAYVRFTPNSQISDSDYANEVYNPPFTPEEDPSTYLAQGQMPTINEEPENGDPSDKLRDLMLMTGIEESPVIMPFEGFRERIQAEQMARDAKDSVPNEYVDKEKKSLAETKFERPTSDNDFKDEERLGAHFRQFKTKPQPNTAEYLVGNQFSPLDAEVRSNALEKYKQSFAEKNFPFEYENPGDIQEPRVYFEEDSADEFPVDTGSGDIDPYNRKESNTKLRNPKYREYLMNYWRELTAARLNAKENMYAEGGPLKPDELQAQKSANQHHSSKPNHNHNDYDYDPSYTFVTFHNRFLTDWAKGMSFIERLEQMLGLEKNTFTNPRVDPYEVTFKVEKNSKGYDAAEVGKRIDAIKDQVRVETGAQIDTIGIGDRSKHPVISHPIVQEPRFFGLSLPVLFALIGSMSVLIVGAVIVAVMLRHDIMGSKRKMQGLASAAEIDAEATRDYQELCRARMSGKWTGQQTAAAPPHPAEPPQRITSLSREPDGNSPSTRSSTSSWSEEPALTNMDISTGHMVLAYMEDHLRNKDRLEQEWRALCAYEAEPCVTAAALKAENNGKNRYADVLPYDHSRVTLNTLSNHLGSDYINASTITDHDPRNPAYIAAAGPLANTTPDFWQLVWEQGSVVMVMLTRLTENGQQLCHRYWPEEGSELYHIYEVHLVSEHIWCDDYLVRSFYLKNQRTGDTRTVTQFHFLSWPENGVPSSTKALLEFRRKVNKSYRGRSCPIVVHCSDGAGRTGTYCLIDMVLNRMAKGAKEIDIAATLEHIRDQRPRTVATKQQFEFVLMAVAEEVHAILKALPAHLQQLQEKKEKDKEKEKEGTEKEKPN